MTDQVTLRAGQQAPDQGRLRCRIRLTVIGILHGKLALELGIGVMRGRVGTKPVPELQILAPLRAAMPQRGPLPELWQYNCRVGTTGAGAPEQEDRHAG